MDLERLFWTIIKMVNNMFVCLISHQPVVLFSQNKSGLATSQTNRLVISIKW
jgi:hypothetical protein